MSKKKTPKKKNDIDLKIVKTELLDDLDQFLVDGDFSVQEIKQEKQKALAELDKLIKQDLSYSQILSNIKEEAKESKLEETEVKEVAIEETEEPVEEVMIEEVAKSSGQSSHVLDLRKSKEEPVKEKKNRLGKYKDSWAKLKESRPKKIKPKKVVKPKIPKASLNFPKLRLQGVGPRIASFAIITALILLPIRGLVLFGQIQDDKSKIINFGQQGLVSLQSGVISASENSYEIAQNDFDEALLSFRQAQDVLNDYEDWTINAASMLPIIGKPLSLSTNMLAVAKNISEAAAILNQTTQKSTNPTEYIAIINQQIDKTIPYLDEANKHVNSISSSMLPANLQGYFDGLKAYLPETLESLKNLNEIFDTLLVTLGHDTEKRYLVLFQNNNELRATGGFIGSFALFDVYQGQVIDMEIPKGGLYDLEAGQKVKLRAPDALSLINPNFNIWDANWWYDFPSSAKKIVWMFEDSYGTSVDGVIAVNADVLQELLKVLGPITLDEYNITITSDNIFDVLQEEVELNYDKEENAPKAVIADLVPVVLEKLLNNNLDQQKELVSVLADTLSTKDIQLYLVDEAMQNKIDNFGWAGRVANNDKDYLAVINTNIAGGKTDKDIHQNIDHQVSIDGNGELIDTVRITRTNYGDKNNPFAGIDGGNVSYLRVYVPLGSEFIEGLGFDQIPDNNFRGDDSAQFDQDVLQEEKGKVIDSSSGVEIYSSLDKTVLAGWMMLTPGESKTVMLKYRLPFQLDFGDPLVNDWWDNLVKKDLELDNYSLLVQSQSGQNNTNFNSSVLLPDNVRVVFNNASEDDKMNVANDLITYSNELIRDQYFGFILATK